MGDVNEARRVRAAVIGASGYAGAETLRLLLAHPAVEVAAMSADRRAGQPIGAVFPHLAGYGLPDLVAVDDIDWRGVDVAFCCLPHGTTQEVVAALPAHVRVVDLSADFRFADPLAYAQVYGRPHAAPELQRDAVYGLTELARPRLREARLVAVPGCYPTAALLPLVPLIEDNAIANRDIIIDAKSGVSGAGRAARESLLYGEVAEGLHAYAVGHHRHAPEIEQALSAAAHRAVSVSFTPHLVPMNRGILSTIYVRLAAGHDAFAVRRILAGQYAGDPFVRVLAEGDLPATRHVRGSNRCVIAVVADRQRGRAIVISVIDNLVKGAAGQAVQNMNVMFDLPETAGLEASPLFP